MDRRDYTRLLVDVDSTFILKNKTTFPREFIGKIYNISERGIQIRVEKGLYADVVSAISLGEIIQFQACDEYDIYDETRVDVFQSVVKVVWMDEIDNTVAFGCCLQEHNDGLDDYIKHRRLSAYLNHNKLSNNEF